MDLVLSARMLLAEPLDLFKYSGAWYEVASYKGGFTNLECLDTRDLYEYNPDTDKVDVRKACRKLNRSISQVRGEMTCPVQKGFPVNCTLTFPDARYIPPVTYRILETDYESYALVEGSENKSYVQIFSRYPMPGLRFIEAKKQKLRDWGYDPDSLHITPVTVQTSSTTDV